MRGNTFLLLAVGLILVLLAGTTGYLMFQDLHKPVVERNNVSNDITYVDRRNPDIYHFYDRGGDGLVEQVRVDYSDYSSRMEISETELEAEYCKIRYELKDYEWLWRGDSAALQLQIKYEEVRREYQKISGLLNLPENQPRPALIDSMKIRSFKDLLAEYREQNRHASIARSARSVREVAAYKAYIAFQEMNIAYAQLNSLEKRLIFSEKNLPSGVKLNSGPEVKNILGMPLTSDNPRSDFEYFLEMSYMDIDYMMAWSIFQNDQAQSIEENYFSDLESKGLKVKR